MKPALKKLLASGTVGGTDAPREAARALIEAYTLFTAKAPPLRPGDLVRWKRAADGTSMKNRKSPAENEVAVVVEVLPQPLYDSASNDSGTPYFHEPLTLVLGLLRGGGEHFVTYHYDGRRFERVDPQT